MTDEIQNPMRLGYFSKTADKIEEHVLEREMKEGDSARVFYVFHIGLLIADLERLKDQIIPRATKSTRKTLGVEERND